MFSKKFLKDTAERAITTAAQVLAGFLVADVAIVAVDWPLALGVTATATVASVLKSIVARGSGDKESASLVPTVGNK